MTKFRNILFSVFFIIFVLLLRIIGLESSYDQIDPEIVNYIVLFIFISPIVAWCLSIAIYIVDRYSGKNKTAKKKRNIFVFSFYGAALGAFIAVVLDIAFTIVLNSPQGPLALIFDAPLGIAAGTLTGIASWVISNHA